MKSREERPRRAFRSEFKAEVVELCGRDDRSIGLFGRDLDLTEPAVLNRYPRSKVAAAVDLIKRAFGPGTIEIDQCWCSDITYVTTWEGGLYVASIIDLASRRVVGRATCGPGWCATPSPSPSTLVGRRPG